MKLSEEQKKEITEKNAQLENIKPILKAEFVGIDSVIDAVINAVRPFYIFPKSLKRPLVINLWGMTATGKTCLVHRLVELLEMQSRFIRFDVGEYTGSDYRLRNELSYETGKVKDKNVVIVFDEFQFGRTIDEHGAEIKSNAMRPVWDLLDSGKIYKINSSGLSELYRIFDLMEKAIDFGIEVENGIVTRGVKNYDSLFKNYWVKPIDFKDVDWKGLGVKASEREAYMTNSYSRKTYGKYFTNPYFIKQSWYDDTFYESNREFFNFNEEFEQVRDQYFTGKDLPEMLKYLKKNLLESKWMMSEDDYSKSLIFCVGNIDEAYHMHESSDPDADADLFYEHSLKITIPKIKDALSRRFRMEQIGRLGNNHIIYPAFNKESYYKLVDIHLDKRKQYFKNEFDIDVTFDKTIHDLMYKEGVFPSQGVRPLLSTFNTIIDSYVSKIISDFILECPQTKKINWKFSYKKEKHVLKVIEPAPGKTFEYDVKLNIEILRKTDYSESQAFTAVHEAGHAVVGVIKGGFLPKEVVSRTASVAEGFCRMEWPEIDTKEMFRRHIMVCLGGIEAEKLIFGENMISAGAYSDLLKATSIASKMVKVYGMSNRNYITATVVSDMNEISAIHDEGKSEIEVENIIKSAEIEVKDCLMKNKLFLLEVSEHLSNNSRIDKEQFRAIAIKFVDENEINDKENFYHFRSTISKLKAEEIAKEKKSIVSIPVKNNDFILNKDDDKKTKK